MTEHRWAGRSDKHLRVLPTNYGGFTFRSRTEARWAVFFDELDIKWDYEREGFEVDGRRYLPDFWLPDLERWLEVKGVAPTEDEHHKAQWLAEATSFEVLLAYGEPRCPDGSYDRHDDSMWHYDLDGIWDSAWWWAECPDCGFVDATFNGRAARLRCRCIVSKSPGEDKVYNWQSPRLTEAYAEARRAFTGPEWRP